MSKAKARQPASAVAHQTGNELRRNKTGRRQTKTPAPTVKPAARRGKLKPMRVSMGFREFVLDQLGGIPDLRAKPMFGGVGLYAGEVFFGIMAADVLYFKADQTNQRDYLSAGSKPFAPYADPQEIVSMSYYSVPAGVLESAPTIAEWAKKSIAVAKAAKKAQGRARNG